MPCPPARRQEKISGLNLKNIQIICKRLSVGRWDGVGGGIPPTPMASPWPSPSVVGGLLRQYSLSSLYYFSHRRNTSPRGEITLGSIYSCYTTVICYTYGMFLLSSAVERSAVNRMVAGSIPAVGVPHACKRTGDATH